MDTGKLITLNYQPPNVKISFLEKYASLILPLILFAADYTAILAAEGIAYWLRKAVIPLFLSNFDIPSIYLYIIVPLIFLSFLHFDSLYIRRMPFWHMTEKMFKASAYAMLSIIVMMYFAGVAQEVSRIFVFLVWVLTFSFLVIMRYMVKKLLNKFGLLQLPVILIGAGKTAELLLKSFKDDAGLGYKVVGIIEDNPQTSQISHRYPVLGTFDRAEDVVKRSEVKNVIIAAPGLERDNLLKLIYRLQPHVKKVAFVPDLFGVPVGSMELETLFHEKLVLLKVRNNLSRRYNRIVKYCFDMFVSIVLAVLMLPFFVIISILIYIDSPGPVVFSHKRVGHKGIPFPCYKFRTMVSNAQEVLKRHLAANPEAQAEWDRDFKLKNDPRITKIGGFLRKTSLDELPQLFNVLKGEMSLVGPRPIVHEEVSRYGEYINDYYIVRPGITGIWQVSGRNDIDYPERVKMDSWYVRNWSVWLDITLLIKTAKVVLERKGAY